MHLAADEQRVLTAVESVLGPLVAGGRARLDVSPAAGSQGALIEIKPTRESACPVTIHCEAPGDLDLYIGRYKLTTHIWKTCEWERRDFAPLENELCEWLTALTAGRYEEEVRLTYDGDAG